jgi:hypothetical protein
MSRKTSKEKILPSVARDLSFFTKPMLLRSECEHEFDEILHALRGEIQPRGIVENLYVEEIAGIIWDILRLRRCKVTIMNMSFEKVLHNLISLHLKMRRPAKEEESKTDSHGLSPFELWQPPPPPTKSEIERSKKIIKSKIERSKKINRLVRGWFTSDEGKQKVLSILRRSHLDDSVIDAEVIRASFSDLQLLEKLLISLEARRDRSLRRMMEYRESFADRVRTSTDRIIEGEPEQPPRLEEARTSKSAA